MELDGTFGTDFPNDALPSNWADFMNAKQTASDPTLEVIFREGRERRS